MKAITVRQPWAWAIMCGLKDVENRSRNIAGNYRGPLVIHAGLAKFEQDNMASRAHRDAHGTELSTVVHFGAALGVVDLIDVHESGEQGACTWDESLCSEWAMVGGLHLLLINPRPFAKPIPYRDKLGLWEFPDDLLPEVAW